MPVTAPTLQETYALLDKAITDIKAKKNFVDNMQKEVDVLVEKLRIANGNYNDAIRSAQDLKQQLHDTLEATIPTLSERVR